MQPARAIAAGAHAGSPRGAHVLRLTKSLLRARAGRSFFIDHANKTTTWTRPVITGEQAPTATMLPVPVQAMQPPGGGGGAYGGGGGGGVGGGGGGGGVFGGGDYGGGGGGGGGGASGEGGGG